MITDKPRKSRTRKPPQDAPAPAHPEPTIEYDKSQDGYYIYCPNCHREGSMLYFQREAAALVRKQHRCP